MLHGSSYTVWRPRGHTRPAFGVVTFLQKRPDLSEGQERKVMEVRHRFLGNGDGTGQTCSTSTIGHVPFNYEIV